MGLKEISPMKSLVVSKQNFTMLDKYQCRANLLVNSGQIGTQVRQIFEVETNIASTPVLVFRLQVVEIQGQHVEDKQI